MRDPIDSFLSLTRLHDYRGRLDIFTYLKGVRIFADIASAIGYVRFEDLCQEPANSLEAICSVLNLGFDERFPERFLHYATITGDNYAPDQHLTLTGERIGDRTTSRIPLPPHREEYTTLSRQLAGYPDYELTRKALGYNSP